MHFFSSDHDDSDCSRGCVGTSWVIRKCIRVCGSDFSAAVVADVVVMLIML